METYDENFVPLRIELKSRSSSLPVVTPHNISSSHHLEYDHIDLFEKQSNLVGNVDDPGDDDFFKFLVLACQSASDGE